MTHKETPDRRLLKLVRLLSASEVQNRLMRISDRLRIRYPEYRAMIENVIEQIGGGGGGPLRSYLRPTR
ncbi:MAG: hypothetical protein R6V67_00335 [Spirochaetia bacterium]